MSASAVVVGAALIILAGRERALSAVGPMALAGFGTMVLVSSANTLLQTLSDADKRGRVMSFYTMSFMGMGPFGSLIVGAVAQRLGTPTAILLGGIAGILAGGVFATRLRRIRLYVLPVRPDRSPAGPPEIPPDSPGRLA